MSVLFCDWTGICCRMLSTSPTSLQGGGRGEEAGEGGEGRGGGHQTIVHSIAES